MNSLKLSFRVTQNVAYVFDIHYLHGYENILLG